MNKPEIGQKIYVGSSFYIGHGEDDFVGGICTINKIENGIGKSANEYYVGIKERQYHSYNYNYLLEHQEEWKEQYGDQIGRPDPDYNDYGERW
jgi:hypothetical protein